MSTVEGWSENARELDQFYTNPLIAKRFVEEIDKLYGFDNFDRIIEPSMGNGYIYQYFPEDKRVGLDLIKNHPDCLEGDFLEWHPDKSNIKWNPLTLEKEKIMFIGNPPFGRNSNLAIEFFKHAAQFSDVICFIIPRTWMKYSIQRQIPKDFGLYWQAVLPDEAFIFNGKPYAVRCVAQCWSRYDPKPESDEKGLESWSEEITLNRLEVLL